MTDKREPTTPVGAAEAIKAVRLRKKMSCREVAAQAGLSPAYVGKVESGAISPSLRTFAKIATVLEMTTKEIALVVQLESKRDKTDKLSHPPAIVES